MKRYKAVIFDMDGTLITLDAIIESINKALESNDYEKLSEEDIKEKIIGYPLAESLQRIMNISEEEAEKVSEDYTRHYLKYNEESEPYPGVEETLRKLEEEGIEIGIATTKKRSEALSSLETYPEIDYNVLIGGDDVEETKPSSEPIEKACKMLGINPKETLYVGDHKVDVKAGKNAGTDVVALTTGIHGKKELEEVEKGNIEVWIKNEIKEVIPIALKEAEEIEKEMKVPEDRIGALIGKKGKTKKKTEKKADVDLEIDSETGEVTLTRYMGRSPEKSIRAIDVIKAIAKGFSPKKSFKLLEKDTYIDTIDISEHSKKSKKDLKRIKSRIIGKKGKTRKNIERLTKTDISIRGKKASIIGKIDQINLAKRGIKKIIQGTPHNSVYRELEEERSKKTW